MRAVKLLLLVFLVSGLGACAQQQSGSTSSTSSPGPPQSESKAVESKPFFTGIIENVSLYPVPNNREDLAVSLVVTISNSGQPSIADKWSLEVSSSDPSIPSGVEPVHINGIVDLPGKQGTKVDLAREDLALNSARTSIGENSSMKGILTFILPKTSEQDLTSNNSSFVVHFKDSRGGSYQTPNARLGNKRSLAKSQ